MSETIEAIAQAIYWGTAISSRTTVPWNKVTIYNRKRFYDTAINVMKIYERQQELFEKLGGKVDVR